MGTTCAGKHYICHIDVFSESRAEGWILHKLEKVDSLVFLSDRGSRIVPVDVVRPNASNYNPGYMRNETCGFKFKPGAVDGWSLYGVFQESVELILSSKACSEKNEHVFFLHIPKSAGSSVNHTLSTALGEGSSLVHIEGITDWPEKLNDKRFISGHVLYNAVRHFWWVKNALRVVVLREPSGYLISHLNWIGHLTEPGNEAFLRSHPNYIQELSSKIYKTDFKDIDSVRLLVDGLSHQQRVLITNSQVRYLSSDISPVDIAGPEYVEAAISNLDEFHVVGFFDSMDVFFDKIQSHLNIELGSRDVRNSLKNKSALGEVSQESWEMLEEFIEGDRVLFDVADSRYRASDIR